MMKSYIEAEYLVHFFNALIKSERFSEEATIRAEILSYLKSKTDIILNSDFLSVLNKVDKSSLPIITTLINTLTTGRNGTTIKTKESNTFRNLRRKDIYSKLNTPFASFWVETNSLNHSIDKYEQANPYYFFTVENELKKWGKYTKEFSYFVGPNANQHSEDVMENWDDLKKLPHPLTDLIIVDRYCLKDKIGIEQNIIPLITNLPLDKSSVKNIIIFVKNGEIYRNSLNQVHELIKNKLKEFGINSKVIIFQSFKTPHDRCIITNNFFISSGDSFDYFNADGSFKTKGTKLSICPIYKTNKSELNSIFKSLKEISSNANENMFYGDKSKNILDLV